MLFLSHPMVEWIIVFNSSLSCYIIIYTALDITWKWLALGLVGYVNQISQWNVWRRNLSRDLKWNVLAQLFFFLTLICPGQDFIILGQVSCIILSSVQSLNHVWLFATPWTAAHQASLSITNSRSLLKLMSHWVGDAIQPFHPLSSPSLPAFNLSQNQGLFQWVSSLHQVAKVLEYQLQQQSFQWIFRTDFL